MYNVYCTKHEMYDIYVVEFITIVLIVLSINPLGFHQMMVQIVQIVL